MEVVLVCVQTKTNNVCEWAHRQRTACVGLGAGVGSRLSADISDLRMGFCSPK